jgi:hypothetical protein
MTTKKNREKVVAEITTFHLTQLLQGLGRTLSREEAIAFLNEGSRAYDMWKQMMLAGEAYIKSALQSQRPFAVRATSSQPHKISA